MNAERAAEEAHGLIRWLRPEFQAPQGAWFGRAEGAKNLPESFRSPLDEDNVTYVHLCQTAAELRAGCQEGALLDNLVVRRNLLPTR